MDKQNSSAEEQQEPSGIQLEIAHLRLLAYMRALHVPVRKRYELASRSLSLAEAEGAPDGNFIGSAMRNLEKVLAGSGPYGFEKELDKLQPMPPLNRGSMLPVSMERPGPFTFFFALFYDAAKRVLRPPLRLYFLLLLLAATLILYWWHFFYKG